MQSILDHRLWRTPKYKACCMGIPILHAVSGESAEIIAKTGGGIVIEPENPVSMAEELIQLSQDHTTLMALGRKGRIASASFDRTILAQDMLKVLEACCPTLEANKGFN